MRYLRTSILSSVINWMKNLAGLLVEFTFINLLIYFYGRDKAFDIQSMKAFRSLKAYKLFLMALLGMHGCMNAQEPVTLI